MGQTADRPKKPGKEEAETVEIWKNKDPCKPLVALYLVQQD